MIEESIRRGLQQAAAGELTDLGSFTQYVEEVPERPTLVEEAERLLGYWEQHGENPEAVAKWAVSDMLGILRYIVEEES